MGEWDRFGVSGYMGVNKLNVGVHGGMWDSGAVYGGMGV
jgi:hypothetical protein